jgi:hypothetical protein
LFCSLENNTIARVFKFADREFPVLNFGFLHAEYVGEILLKPGKNNVEA